MAASRDLPFTAPEGKKWCWLPRARRGCKRLLSLEAFHRKASSADGRNNLCRDCACAEKQAAYDRAPDRFRRRRREWRRVNPKRAAELDASYREKNRGEIRARERARRTENPDAVNAAQRRRYHADPEAARAVQRASYAKHAEKRRAYARRRREAREASAR
jgi:hypothetical protein